MFENNYPLFNKGRLLKIDMLKELRDFPRELSDINFKNYSDGIIKGCDIEVTADFINVKKGLIKHNNTLYLLKENAHIPYECNNKLTILKVKFLPETKDSDFLRNSAEIYLDENIELKEDEMEICRFQLRSGARLRNNHVDFNDKDSDFLRNSAEIYLDENIELKEDEMEICRFQLRSGARLRNNHVDFNDLATEYDTVNIIHAPYAALEESSLCPKILRRFGSELLKCNVKESWDIAFGMHCIQSKEPITKEIIVDYLMYKLNITEKNYSNEDLYFYLLEVLNKAKDGSGSGEHHGRMGFRKILID